jgi:hypothetical protein
MTLNAKTMIFIGFAALLGGCVQTRYVALPTPPAPPAGRMLQACADHAASAQRGTFGGDFRALQLDTRNAVLASPAETVGNQPVAAAYDGTGTWFGQPQGALGEWRKVRYHCLISPAGQVVYSFIRAE